MYMERLIVELFREKKRTDSMIKSFNIAVSMINVWYMRKEHDTNESWIGQTFDFDLIFYIEVCELKFYSW